jgi:hypothetical protein
MLERELDDLCSLYKSEKEFWLSLFDLSDKGIDRSTKYLEKVAGLEGLKASQEWAQLKAIQKIRNTLAHEDGQLLDRDGKPKNDVLKAMTNLGNLRGEHELIIEHGFLVAVVNVCEAYFKRINTAIEAHERLRQ